jgi:predicted metal-dependent peptidase
MTTYTLTPEQRVRKAIITLQDKQPFFAHLALACELYRIDDEEGMRKIGMPYPTFGVDARGRFYFHVDAVTAKTGEEILGTTVHEILHIAFEHPSSLEGRERMIANYAQDIAVNMIVWSNGFVMHKDSVKVDVARDEGYVYLNEKLTKKITIQHVSDKCWQEIYEELLKLLPKQMTCPNCGGTVGEEGEGDGQGQSQGEGEHKHKDKGIPCQCGDWHDYGSAEGMTEKEKQEVKQYWQNRVVEAATIAKQRGVTPVGMQRIVDELVKPKVQWKDILRRMVKQHTVPVDLAYRKLHKKSHQLGVYMPGMIKETREIEVVVDTSGSIGKNELTEFVSEIVGMAKSNNRIKMGITFCDAEVQSHYDIANGNIPKIMAMEAKGGGGTQMEKGLDFIKEKNPRVPVVIVLTDGCDCYERTAKDYSFDVIWCLSEHGVTVEQHSARYGKKIKIGR